MADLSHLSDEARLARFVKRGAPDECWPWFGRSNVKGYGRLRRNGGSRVLAHRLALSLALGRPIPEGMFVIHSCDNPPCCNPAHLRIGTRSDNAQDRLERQPESFDAIRTSRCKLTAAQVQAIQERYAAGGISAAALGAQYGVGESTVLRKIHGEFKYAAAG